ncbi:MAG: leucine-rich repeat protein [Clostridia bacterium]|nr:leucine-rich repeat protein [Clostridia bacterium]
MKTLKYKLCVLALAVALLFASLPVAATAAATPTLRLSYSYNAEESCIATVTVSLENSRGLSAAALNMTYDPALLLYVGASAANDNGLAMVDSVDNAVYYSAAFDSAVTADNIDLFTVRFGVLQAGTARFTVSVTEKQIAGVKAPASATLTATFAQPQQGMPYYTYSMRKDGTAQITGVLTDRSYITVPAVINGVKVTAIGARAFAGQTALKGVTLPAGIVSIENDAFSGCAWLKSVTLPDTLTNIEARAFYQCASLTDIALPESVEYIESSAFRYCKSLRAVKLPSKVSYLGDNAFGGCKSLETVDFGKVNYIGVGAFADCEALKTVALPAGVVQIGARAFLHCRALTSVTLPSSLESIEARAFDGCTSLQALTIPANVAQIGENAFARCTSLETIAVAAGNTRYRSDKNIALYNRTGTELIKVAPKANLTDYDVLANAVIIDAEAFADHAKLEKITLPAGVITVGEDAFFNCVALKEISVSTDNSVYYSKDGVLYYTYTDFDDNTTVTLVCLPIASGRTTFEVPAAVTNIAAHALYGCTDIAAYSIERGNSRLMADRNGVLFNNTKTELIAYPAAREEETYAISNTVRTVRDGAFYGAKNLKSITASSMYFKNEDNGALLTGDKTELAVYPAGLAADSYAMPKTLVYVAASAFAGVDCIGTLEIPVSVTSIAANAFADSRFSAVVYNGTEAGWNAVSVGDRNDGLYASGVTFASVSQEPADLVPVNPDPPAPEFMLGDLNGDKKVNSVDARLALRAAARLDTLTDVQRLAADIDGDGKVGSGDARRILRAAARLEALS